MHFVSRPSLGFSAAVRTAVVGFALFAITLPLLAASQRRAVFEPEKFIRETGSTTTFTRTFNVPEIVGGPFILRIANGAPDGKGGTKNAIASASVLVDGREVARQQDFSGQPATIEKPVTLATGAHNLEVRLNGSPDNYFTLTIEGVIALDDLAQARSGHTATLLGDGGVLFAGGRDATGASSSSAERFDGNALTTASLAGGTLIPRSEHAAAALPRPQTLLIGGLENTATLNSGELFDHVTRAFTALAATTQISRSGATATTLVDGRIVILGGTDASGNTVGQVESFQNDALTGAIYDPAAGTFHLLQHALLTPRSNHTATALPDGRILVTGGRNGQTLLASAELFDPATGVSSAVNAAMNVARAEHSATLLPDGSVLVAGGRAAGGIIGTTEIYRAGTWTEGPSLLVARANHTATLLPAGEILIAGGESGTGATANTELVGPPAADDVVPVLRAIAPANGTIDVFRNIVIGIRFAEPVRASSITAQSVRLTAGTEPVSAALTLAESGLYAFIAPDAVLQPGMVHTVTIDGVTDVSGNAIAATSSTFTTIAPPAISGYSPTHALAGAALTISGDHFDATAARNTVTIGGAVAPVTTATRTALTVTIPQLAAGAHAVTVKTLGGTTTGTDAFIVDNPAPVLISIAPAEVSTGGTPVNVTFDGSGFVLNSTVMLRGATLPTQFVSPVQLRATIPSLELTSPGTLLLSVFTPSPGGGMTSALPLTVKASKAAIGNYVWHDANANGIQENGAELPLAGITVRLLNFSGNLVATTTSNGAGAYRFSDVEPGSYFVEFVAPAGYSFAPRFAVADTTVDSDADAMTGRTAAFALMGGADRNDIDAGFITPLTEVTTSPLDGDANVAVTRETIFRLSNELASDAVVTSQIAYAEQGGVRLATRIHVSPDRKTITLFYDRDLPASARVKAVLNGNLLRDRFGALIGANGNGTPGGFATVRFDTVTLTTLPDTRACGRVFASQLAPNGTSSINVPLAGVTITVDGLETTLRTTTDANGNFCLDPAPAGEFFVHIDGRSATNPIAVGDYYPSVGKLWKTVAGTMTSVGDIFLPRIIAGTLQPVSSATDTVINMPPSVLAQFPQLEGVHITVPANSLYSDDGSRGGRVGIAPVPPDRLPAPLPQGLSFPLVITVQTDGGGNFDRPVPACFPNLPNRGITLAPGAESALWSFNHDTGFFEVVGPMTVTIDGKLVCTNPGVGILAPGWHGTQPGCDGDSDQPGDDDSNNDDNDDENDDDEEEEKEEEEEEEEEEEKKKDCEELKKAFGDEYQKAVNTAGVIIAHQLKCLADKSCDKAATQPGGKMPEFVDNMLNQIADNIGKNKAQEKCKTWERDVLIPMPPTPPLPFSIIPPFTSQELCAIDSGSEHFEKELKPGFESYCDTTGKDITQDDHDYLLDSVNPCFDQIKNAGEMGRRALLAAKTAIKPLAAYTRWKANNRCETKRTGGKDERPISVMGALTSDTQPDLLFSAEELFEPELDTMSSLRVRATDGSYFLRVGSNVQMRITRTNPDGTIVDVTPTSHYMVLDSDATVVVSPTGVLSIRKAPLTYFATIPFFVLVYEHVNNEWAIGQFAVIDDDSDGDSIVDSAERSAGTDPLASNGLADADFDGVIDVDEIDYGLKPLTGDSDGDRISDADEHQLGRDPLKSDVSSLSRRTGVMYYSVTNVDSNFVMRGVTTAQGTASNIIMSADTRYRAAYYDPADDEIGRVQYRTGRNGTRMKIPIAIMKKTSSTDTDVDGLTDEAEEIIGTNPFSADSDGDGVKDGAEIDQHTDPLSGTQARTGIIATAPTAGAAVDVAALDELVAVAASGSGVALFNVFNGMNPTVVAQVDTAGNARAVAFSRRTIAVADGAAGLAVIDASSPSSARLLRQVALVGNAQCVVASAGIAYVGTDSGRLAAIDLASGSIVQELMGLNSVQDVAIEGDTLYLANHQELRAYSLSSLAFLGKITSSGYPEAVTGRRRLFVGGGIAYVTSYPGYDTIDVSDPAAMRLLGPARDVGPNSFKQIVANGTGLGVAAVGVNPRSDGTHDVWIYNVSNPAVTTGLLTQIATPGLTRAVAIYNGVAYAADSESGLQVVNYLASDIRGVAPTIVLRSNFSAGVAEEGKAMRLTAAVTDDVQVRNVEFYVDGVRVVTDGNFPFEHRFITPLILEQPSFTIHACATDTGGNRTCTPLQVIALTPDATAPRVTNVSPANLSSAVVGSVSALSANFSEPIAVSMLTATTFRLFAAGPDNVAGTPDDVLMTGGSVTYRSSSDTAFLTFPTALADNNYRAVISGTITDLHGNPLGSEYAWTFRVRGPLVWINPAGGNWNDANNWNEKVVPAAGDNAFITLAGTYTVVADRSTAVTRVIIGAGATLHVRGSGVGSHVTMTVSDTVENNGTIRFESADSSYASRMQLVNGATLVNRGTIQFDLGTGGERRIDAPFVQNTGSIIANADAVIGAPIVSSGLINTSASRTLTIPSGFSLTQTGGSISNAGGLVLDGAAFIMEGGTVTGNAPHLRNSGLTIGAAATGAASFWMTGTATLGGRTFPGQSIWVRGGGFGHTTITAADGFINGGAIRVESVDSSYASRLHSAGTLINDGSIDINVGTGGDRTMAMVNLVNRGVFNVSYSVRLDGTLTNSGAVNIAPSRQLLMTGRRFDQNGGTIQIQTNGELRLDTNSTFNFSGGTVTPNAPLLINTALNFGSSATGAASFIMGGTAAVSGKISSGQTLWIRGSGDGHTTTTLASGFVNAGALRIESIQSTYASNVTGDLTNAATGVVTINSGPGGSRAMTGNWTNAGTITLNYGITLTGSFTNTGTLAIAAGQKLTHNGTGVAFNQNAGTLNSGTGLYELTSGTFNFNGGTTTGNLPYLLNCVVAMNSPASAGSLLVTGSGTKLSGTIGAQQSVWINGNGAGSHTTASTNPTLRNEGTLRIESTQSTYASNLTGTLTNALGGTVTFASGPGGARQFDGTLTNEGTININVSVSMLGTIVNAGNINIAVSQQLKLIGAAITLKQNGGTIAGPGSLQLEQITFENNGGTITAPFLMLSGRLKLASNAPNTTLIVTGAPVITGTIYPTQVLWVRGSGLGGHTTLSLPEGLVNAGTLRLQSIESSYSSNVAIGAGQTLANTGAIESFAGSGGSRLITGTVANGGLFDVKLATLWAGSLSNNGTIAIAANQKLTHSGNSVFNNNAGTVTNAGIFEFQTGTPFNQVSGSVTGNPVMLIRTKLNLVGNGIGAFTMLGGSQLEGDISPGQTIWVHGTGAGGDGNLAVAGSFTNNGSLRLESAQSSYASNMTVGGTFTNAATMDIGAGSGGARLITGTVVNNGTIEAKLSLLWAGTFTNNGTINLGVGHKLTHNGTSTFNHNGGAINVLGTFEIGGTGVLNYNGGTFTGTAIPVLGGRVNLVGTGAGSFVLQGGSSLLGTIAAAQTVWINGSGSRGDANVSAPNGLTNAGVLRLESIASSYASNINVSGTLTNTGTVEIGAGSGGSRVLTANVINRGTFNVRLPVTVNGTAFDNAAGGTLRGTSSVVLSQPAATLTNSGSIAPGVTVGTLTLPRATQMAAGSVDIEIGSLTSYDRLAVTGALTLDGVLNISLINGYVPNMGETFDVVTFGSRSGAFATINGSSIGGGKKFQAAYGTGVVKLTVVAE